MKTLAIGLTVFSALACLQPAQASTILSDFTVQGTQTVYFAGRTQSELSAIAAGANPLAFGTPFLLGDISDFLLTSPDPIDVAGFQRLSMTANGLWSHTPSLTPPRGTGPA